LNAFGATSGVWVGNNGSWSSPSNWSTAPAYPNGIDDSALFSGLNGTGALVTVASPGTVDIANNVMITGKNVPITQYQNQIRSGYHNGDWTGTGITSSAAAADPTHKTVVVVDNALLGLTTFAGVAVTSYNLIIESTWLGDSNLDRKVDVTDLGTLATNYGQSTPNSPLAGDFNNDGKVDVTNLGLLATNYGAGTNGAPFSLLNFEILTSSSVPEPSTLALLSLTTLPLLRRNRR
jgi:hypothetical protein